MFRSCSNLVTLDLSSFNTYNVIEMAAMFNGCSKLTTIIAGDDWNVGGVTESNNMFRNCTKLVGGAGTTYSSSHMDKSYAHFDYGPSSNAPGYLTPVVMPYANFDTNTTTLTFYCDNQYIFRNSGRLDLAQEEGNLPGWRTFNGDVTSIVFDPSFAQARPKTTYYWFEQMENLTSITGLEYLNTSETTSMYGMFYGCKKLTSLDLSSFNTDNVTNMAGMFLYCMSLTSVDLSGFTNARVERTSNMFEGCYALTTIYVDSGWSLPADNYSYAMFADCTSLVGGMGTTYDENHMDAEYARIDGGPSNPGYFTEKPAFLRGDVDGDTHVDINDVTKLIGVVLGTTTTGYNAAAADCDVAGGSGNIDINDVTALLNFVLNGHW
jgi:surface protein